MTTFARLQELCDLACDEGLEAMAETISDRDTVVVLSVDHVELLRTTVQHLELRKRFREYRAENADREPGC